MNCSDKADPHFPSVPQSTDAAGVLAREAGVPFQRLQGGAGETDPWIEWLSLMEVVQMLCPVWPVRDQPPRGDQWRI